MAYDTLFLLNPKSKEGKAEKLWDQARKSYSILPADPVDITQIDVEALIKERKPQLVVIAGGDGSINAVVTAVSQMTNKPLLSIMPFGFGNALSYCLGVETIEKAVAVLQEHKKTTTIDLLRTNITDHKIGVFNISVGYDARIVFNRQHHKYIGIKSYILSALRSFVSHPEQEIKLTIDKKVSLTARASSLVVANCPIIGHNYIVSPKAKLDDGLLDCTLFSTKYDYLTNLRFRGFKHPLYNELGKVRFKASHIRIEGEPYIQIDGDPVLEKEGIEIEVLPAQITFLRNSDEQIDQTYLPFIV